MYELFQYLIHLLQVDEDSLDDDAIGFLHFACKHLVDEECDGTHLTVPVFSYVKPTMGVHFILHVAISMGRFASEVDLCLQPSLRKYLQYAKLISPLNNPIKL